jgi:2-alkyl-3-oxoalkanoate reductase
MNALVTGGGGFLGSAIVRRLLARGDRVRSLARGLHPQLDALGVEQVQGDVADLASVEKAVADCHIVYHVAARAGIWGRFEDYQRTNVEGTLHVILACRRHGVGRLVYTSSPSVVFDGRDMAGVDESVPYPARYEAHYPRTKAEAERLVLQANGSGLATVALRPHLIWGPGDNHLVPRILARGEPIPLWDLVNKILDAAGLPPVRRTIPVSVAYALGWWLEGVYGLLRWQAEPPMTRFLARLLSTAHWFDISAARRDLGYEPLVSLDEGMKRLRQSLQPGHS